MPIETACQHSRKLLVLCAPCRSNSTLQSHFPRLCSASVYARESIHGCMRMFSARVLFHSALRSVAPYKVLPVGKRENNFTQ